MAEIHRLPDSARALREASEWVARLAGDAVSGADRAAFESWRSAHAVNARAYVEVSGTWKTLLQAGPLVRAVSFGSAMDDARLPQSQSRPWFRAAIAAGAIFATAIVAWYQFSAAPQSRFETAIGEHVRVSLPDGSSLELNSNSLARVEFSADARVIRLDRGEAFFEVAHDTSRPFWVVARDSWVRAVGTAFGVYLKSTSVEVTVSEGTVKVVGSGPNDGAPPDERRAGQSVAVLAAGERAKVSNGHASVYSLATSELARAEAWRRGSVFFEDQPLGEVIEEMERYADLKIELDDPAIGARHVGGTFQSNPGGVEAFLTMLEDGLDLRVRRVSDNRVTIEGDHSQ